MRTVAGEPETSVKPTFVCWRGPLKRPFAVAVSKSIEGYVQTPLGANDFSEAWRAD